MTLSTPPARRGRKPLGAKPLDVKINIRATPEEQALFKQLGGSSWARLQLQEACVPEDRQPPSACRHGASKRIQVRVSPELAEKFRQLGGANWLRVTMQRQKTARLALFEQSLQPEDARAQPHLSR